MHNISKIVSQMYSSGVAREAEAHRAAQLACWLKKIHLTDKVVDCITEHPLFRAWFD